MSKSLKIIKNQNNPLHISDNSLPYLVINGQARIITQCRRLKHSSSKCLVKEFI